MNDYMKCVFCFAALTLCFIAGLMIRDACNGPQVRVKVVTFPFQTCHGR